MNGSFPRVLAALIALAFVLAACSNGSGSTWTPAPDEGAANGETTVETPAPEEPTKPEEPTEPEETAAPEEPTEPVETAAPEEPTEPEEPVAPPSGEARVIELQADNALRFTDATGQPISDIPVTPGETVIFRVDNTAGFAHNLYIGTDAELSVPNGTTDVGIPDWSTGVQELEWLVPADLTDLKFACTVPGHYFSMQGTFSTAASTEVAAVEEPVEADESAAEAEAPATEADAPATDTEAPATEADVPATEADASVDEPVEPAAAMDGEARVIELEANAAIRFLQNGEQVRELGVTPGETVIFRVDNTAGFAHNLYIGTDAELSVPNGTTDVGIPDWDLGVQELEWVVPEDISGIRFACTVPGHYYTMLGDFVVSQ